MQHIRERVPAGVRWSRPIESPMPNQVILNMNYVVSYVLTMLWSFFLKYEMSNFCN